MKLLINKKQYVISDKSIIGGGCEGDVYALNDSSLAKIYHDDMLTDERKEKVLALCNFADSMKRSISNPLPFPQYPAYANAIDNNEIVGFSMVYFKDAYPLCEVQYNLSKQGYKKDQCEFSKENERKAIDFVYKLFALLERLHSMRVVLGDVKPDNILCDMSGTEPLPIIVDLDSAQFGHYWCAPVATEDYTDPMIDKVAKRPNGSYMYSSENDIFSMACVAFEFLCGIHPFCIRQRPPSNIKVNKERGISVIGCNFSDGVNRLNQLGVKYLMDKNETCQRRLNEIKNIDKNLFDFFFSTFTEGERKNLVYSLKGMENPHYKFLHDSGALQIIKDEANKKRKRLRNPFHRTDSVDVRLLIEKNKRRNKSHYHDPREFTLFCERYGLHVDDFT